MNSNTPTYITVIIILLAGIFVMEVLQVILLLMNA